MRKDVVVVDDNQLTRLLVSDALRNIGYEPITYASAADALHHIRIDPPAACVVDYTMPKMTGADFIHALRASPDARVAAIPVVGLTVTFERELLEAGAISCLRKPFSEARLARALADAITRWPRAGEPAIATGMEPRDLDRRTVQELARVLEERLAAIETLGSCPHCHHSEAHAFLEGLRDFLARSPVERERKDDDAETPQSSAAEGHLVRA